MEVLSSKTSLASENNIGSQQNSSLKAKYDEIPQFKAWFGNSKVVPSIKWKEDSESFDLFSLLNNLKGVDLDIQKLERSNNLNYYLDYFEKIYSVKK